MKATPSETAATAVATATQRALRAASAAAAGARISGVRRGGDDHPLFATMRGDRLSRDALEHLVRKHALVASASCPSLVGKRVSPHIPRHSTAMELLQHGVDQTVIALWLGQESVETTQVYLHADLRLKGSHSGPLSPGRHAARVPGSALIMPSCRVALEPGSAGPSSHAA
jgi:site-specific recombinase XerD